MSEIKMKKGVKAMWQLGTSRSLRGRLFIWFAKSTSSHGFNRIVTVKNGRRKALWIAIVTLAFIVVVSAIFYNTWMYFQYDTVTEIKAEIVDSLEFPAITICNLNMISKTAATAKYETDSNFRMTIPPISDGVGTTATVTDVTGSGGDNNDSLTFDCSVASCPAGLSQCKTADIEHACCILTSWFCDGILDCMDFSDEEDCGGNSTITSPESITLGTAPPFNQTVTYMRNKVDSMLLLSSTPEDGWQLNDFSPDSPNNTTLLECKFNGEKCNAKWFKKTSTALGNCYTFNHPDLELDSAQPIPLNQVIPGAVQGLLLTIDIQTYEYTSDQFYVGAAAFVHHKDYKPDTDVDRTLISPGAMTNVEFARSMFLDYKKPWGSCDIGKTLVNSDGEYTRHACIEECRVLHAADKCGCHLFYTSLEGYPPCTGQKAYECVMPAYDEIDMNVEKYCDCPMSCKQVLYATKISSAGTTMDQTTVDILNNRYYGNKSGNTAYQGPPNLFYKENIAMLQFYFGSMLDTRITTRKAIDEIGLLCQYGGILGLFVGFSMLTLCEVIETLIFLFTRQEVPEDE